MKLLRVAAASLNQTPIHWARNLNNIKSAVSLARTQQVSLLCLPEMAITGYGCEDAFLSPSLQQTALDMLGEIVDVCRDITVAVGLPVNFENTLYNCVALISDGELCGIVAKQYLAGDGIHYEPRWFKPWPSGKRGALRFRDTTVPFGDILFAINGVRIGFEICEDAWVAERPGVQLAKRGVDIILNPSASHFSFGKHEIRKSFVREGSRAFAAIYVYTNLVGNEAGRIVYDGGPLIAAAGKMMATGKRFTFEPVMLLAHDVDIEHTRMHKTQRPASLSEAGAVDVSLTRAHFSEPVSPLPRDHRSEDAVFEKADEFARAVSLGLWDYMTKSRSRGFVLSLSGGADSSAVATLIRIMVELALREIGEQKIRAAAPWISMDAPNADAIMSQLLTCIYQSTRHSSAVTLDAARTVAQSVGAQFMRWDVDNLVSSYTHMLERSIERPLSWDTDDLALQNIQARVRAPGVWMLANIKGALLISTSNRSEAAVGYATMDGDTSGGLSPIAGIDKAYLLDWLREAETAGVSGLASMPWLRVITSQNPTAELRPIENEQTDEGDLMPYPVLEAIEKLAIRDRKGPVQIYRLLKHERPESGAQLKQWVRRFFTLWSRNQWKRERYAPSFHLDDKNLDPKTWCRFPILSGGFSLELDLMDKES
ncbi:MAG: NAD(+) synthase [Deltaproteobacteria bacterium]|nr:NAD(+) synthase [Deltaproteobacteria bacterium]